MMFAILFAVFPFFFPPSDWQCAQPKHRSPHVQIGFVGKGSTDFCPSINLATEEVDISLKEYVKAVKGTHLSKSHTTWRDLGKFSMKAGEGRLTEIGEISPWGDVTMLQALFVKDTTAYILTAAVLKKDFPRFKEEILQSLQSFDLVADLFSPLSDKKKRLKLQHLFSTLGHFSSEENIASRQREQWEQLQKTILEECSEMGGYWHFLALKEGYAKIHSPRKELPTSVQ